MPTVKCASNALDTPPRRVFLMVGISARRGFVGTDPTKAPVMRAADDADPEEAATSKALALRFIVDEVEGGAG